MEGRAVKTQAMAELYSSVHYIQTDIYQVLTVRHKSDIQRHTDTDERDVCTQKAFPDNNQ